MKNLEDENFAAAFRVLGEKINHLETYCEDLEEEADKKEALYRHECQAREDFSDEVIKLKRVEAENKTLLLKIKGMSGDIKFYCGQRNHLLDSLRDLIEVLKTPTGKKLSPQKIIGRIEHIFTFSERNK